MREVFVDRDHARVGFYRSVLEEAGIQTFIRNEFTHNSLTEIPSPLFYPTLCVVQDTDYDEAMRLLGPIYQAKAEVVSDWPCPQCKEEVPGSFESCWSCGTLKSGVQPAE